jgi:hypothetical protein
VAIIGLVVNSAFNLGNVYGMTTAFLWALTVVFVYLGLYTNRKNE